MTRILKLLGS